MVNGRHSIPDASWYNTICQYNSWGIVWGDNQWYVEPTDYHIQFITSNNSPDNLVIEWPTEEDDEQPPPPVAQKLVESLLQHEPQQRLGSATRGGVAGVKEQEFFRSVDWHMLLRQKAQFVPELHGEDDTSYFDSKSTT